LSIFVQQKKITDCAACDTSRKEYTSSKDFPILILFVPI